MDTKQQFFDAILKEYIGMAKGQIPIELIDSVAKGVSSYYYTQYKRFKTEKPKSGQRYSSFQVKDLDHPYAHEKVIEILKEEVGNGYESYTVLFLDMTLDELRDFERNREEFYKMF